jgi:hypothetical protein
MADRFVLRQVDGRPYGNDSLAIVDNTTGLVVGSDGGEPEDQTLNRDWSWVVPLLNRLAAEAEQYKDLAKQVDRLRQEVAALRYTNRELEEELASHDD